MRAIWKGAITFGLVNVPIKVYSATEDHDVGLHQVHDADGGRIRYQRRCEVCGKVVDYEHIDKAYAEGDTTVVLTEDDLKSLPEERSREIEVVEFVPSEQIDPIMFDRSYFLEPEKTAVKAYALLRRTLEETDRTAIVQFSLRQKTRLGALRTRGKVLMLQSLLWDDEVREADFDSLDADVRVSAQELKMASLAGRQHGDRLRAGQVQRRLPGAAADPDRGQARAGRRARHGGHLRRGAEEQAGRRRGDRPDGGPAAQRRAQPGQRSGTGSAAGRRRRQPRRAPREEGTGQEERGQEGGRRRRATAKKSSAKKTAKAS